MCLSTPGQVIDVQGARALVRTRGRTIWCNALAQPDVRVDDYVITHANLIFAIISSEEAKLVQEAVAVVQGWTADSGTSTASNRGGGPDGA